MPRRTPLYDVHRALGARCVDFAGWEMPVSYAGAAEEHRAVRERCGLFDVSHMGEIEVTGATAAGLCQRLTTNDVSRLADGGAQYTVLCNERGGVIDDLIVYRLGAERYLCIVNASNAETDHRWFAGHAAAGATVVDRSDDTALLALQGPLAERVLQPLVSRDLSTLRRFAALECEVASIPALVARTGYTGEDGFEVMIAARDAVHVWNALHVAATAQGGMAAGLAARDTLRLEAGLPLHGSDMDAETTPLEAGLGWIVKLDKGDFVGREALAAQKRQGVPRRLVGLEMDEASVPRHGYPVWNRDAVVGTVTSGARGPTIGRFVGMAYVTPPSAVPGTAVAVEIRGRHVPARVVRLPFYRRTDKET